MIFINFIITSFIISFIFYKYYFVTLYAMFTQNFFFLFILKYLGNLQLQVSN